jgi:hypothetical protein
MIEKIIIAAFVAFGYGMVIFRPELVTIAPMREAVSYDGLALIALIFTVTTAAAVTVNARVLEIKRRLPQSDEVVSASADLRRTMRRNTLGFFYGFFIAAGSYFSLTIGRPESQFIAAFLIVTFFSVLIVGFYLALDVYRVTFGLIETEADLDEKL